METYSYDPSPNCLPSVLAGGVTRSFTYSASGNVAVDDVGGSAMTLTYNAADRLVQVSAGARVQRRAIAGGHRRDGRPGRQHAYRAAGRPGDGGAISAGRAALSGVGNKFGKFLADESGSVKLPPWGSGGGKYDVGAYRDMARAARDSGLDAHHVGQKRVMRDFVSNYDLESASAILVHKIGHTIKGPYGIVSRNTTGFENARQVVARDIKELRRVYPDIPNSQLIKLIELNKKMYKEVR